MFDTEENLQFKILLSSGRRGDVWKEVRRERRLRHFIDFYDAVHQKRGKWDWIFLAYVTVVMFTYSSASSFDIGHSSNTHSVVEIFLLLVWCLIAFRRFRRAAALEMLYAIKLLGGWTSQNRSPMVIKFYDDYFILEAPGKSGGRYNYTSIENFVEKKNLLFLILPLRQGFVFTKNDFLFGDIEDFRRFLLQKRNSLPQEPETFLNYRFAACYRADERTLEVVSVWLTKRKSSFKGWWIGAGIVTIYIFLSCVYFIIEQQIDRSVEMAFSYLILLIMVCCLYRRMGGARGRKGEQERKLRTLKEREKKKAGIDTMLYFEEEALTLKNQYIIESCSYKKIQVFEPHEDFFLVQLHRNGIFLLWKDSFSYGNPECFPDFIHEKCPNAFAKESEKAKKW